jgi:phosphatidylglycerol lysyltransferase
MDLWQTFAKRFTVPSIISAIMALHAFAIIMTPMVVISVAHRAIHFYPSRFLFDVQLLLALALLYLSILLRRRKRNAWRLTIVVYAVLAVSGMWRLTLGTVESSSITLAVVRDIFIPILVVSCLVLTRSQFTVRSDVRAFAISVRISALVLFAAFLYGVGGFIALDSHDYHAEISITEASHRTIDQFGLTTNAHVTAQTRRARVFEDSLSLVSTAAVGFVFVSLFQPIRQLATRDADRRRAQKIIKAHTTTSEDFFKLWPHDKAYFFNQAKTAVVAYVVRGGTALVAGDPVGRHRDMAPLLDEFMQFCRVNGWSPAFIHTASAIQPIYQTFGFSRQKIGEEAIVAIDSFVTQTSRSKYFRQITNRFTKRGLSVAYWQPPHSAANIAALQAVSDDWLSLPGRKERGFMMGSFSAAYMQQCRIAVLRNPDGSIEAFLNQLPDYHAGEASYDLLRHRKTAPGNSSDFLLSQWLMYLHQHDYRHLNLGLCPLSGLEDTEEQSAINNALHFLYANGDRFYSFSGLRRFKDKYQPTWTGRYVVYRGGLRGFTQVLTALGRALRHQ